jgi:hypothetical protein
MRDGREITVNGTPFRDVYSTLRAQIENLRRYCAIGVLKTYSFLPRYSQKAKA